MRKKTNKIYRNISTLRKRLEKTFYLYLIFCLFSLSSRRPGCSGADLKLSQHPDRVLCKNSQLVEAVNYSQKELHTRCCSSPRSASVICF